VYASGSVVVRQLPPEVHGGAAERMVSLRRLDGGALGEAELARHVAHELEKARAAAGRAPSAAEARGPPLPARGRPRRARARPRPRCAQSGRRARCMCAAGARAFSVLSACAPRRFGRPATCGADAGRDAALHVSRPPSATLAPLPQVPARLELQPAWLAAGEAPALGAGATLPETAVAVLSGGGARMVRGALGGERRQGFSVTQRLWRLAPGTGARAQSPRPGRRPGRRRPRAGPAAACGPLACRRSCGGGPGLQSLLQAAPLPAQYTPARDRPAAHAGDAARGRAGAGAQAARAGADAAESDAPAAKQRKKNAGKKAAARAAEPADGPGDAPRRSQDRPGSPHGKEVITLTSSARPRRRAGSGGGQPHAAARHVLVCAHRARAAPRGNVPPGV